MVNMLTTLGEIMKPDLFIDYNKHMGGVDRVDQQLLAYHVAVIKGKDVDKPRNLAKSVTVE